MSLEVTAFLLFNVNILLRGRKYNNNNYLYIILKEKAVNKQNYSPAFQGNINNYCYLVYVVNLTRMWFNNILLPLTLYQESLNLLKMFKISGEIIDYGEDPL